MAVTCCQESPQLVKSILALLVGVALLKVVAASPFPIQSAQLGNVPCAKLTPVTARSEQKNRARNSLPQTLANLLSPV